MCVWIQNVKIFPEIAEHFKLFKYWIHLIQGAWDSECGRRQTKNSMLKFSSEWIVHIEKGPINHTKTEKNMNRKEKN